MIGLKMRALSCPLSSVDYIVEQKILFEITGFQPNKSQIRKKQMEEELAYDGYTSKDIQKKIKRKGEQYKRFIRNYSDYQDFPYFIVIQDHPPISSFTPEDDLGSALYGDIRPNILSKPFSWSFDKKIAIVGQNTKTWLTGLCSISKTKDNISICYVLNEYATNKIDVSFLCNLTNNQDDIYHLDDQGVFVKLSC